MIKAPKWFDISNYERELGIEDWVVEFEKRCDLKDIFGLNLCCPVKSHGLAEGLANEVLIKEMVTAKPDFSYQRVTEKLHKYLTERFEADKESVTINPEFKIDLFSPDDVQIDQLKKQLKQNRDVLAKVCDSSFSPTRLMLRMKSWHTHRVLAVFDIFYWSRLSRQTISNEDIALIIWPDGSDNLEKLVRYSLPLAINDINRLWLQALISNYLQKK